MLYFNWCHIVWGSFSIVTVSRILFTTPFLRSDECLGFLAHFQIFFFFVGQGIPSGEKRIWSVTEKKKVLGCRAHDFCAGCSSMIFSPLD